MVTSKLQWIRKKRKYWKKRIASIVTGDDLVPTDIIPLVVYAWDKSFAIIPSNKKATSDCDWYLFNRILLLEPILRETLTVKDVQKEKEEGLNPMYDKALQQNEKEETVNGHQGPSMRVNTNSNVAHHSTLEDINTHNINFSNGLTQYYIKNIIRKTEKRKEQMKLFDNN
jgi:hypothetical protein